MTDITPSVASSGQADAQISQPSFKPGQQVHIHFPQAQQGISAYRNVAGLVGLDAVILEVIAYYRTEVPGRLPEYVYLVRTIAPEKRTLVPESWLETSPHS
jgi:hypothetical protein